LNIILGTISPWRPDIFGLGIDYVTLRSNKDSSDITFTVGFYAGLNLIAWGMIFCFVRETKQLTLEEIDRQWPYMLLSSQ
jgi:hypothetical protein